jgi:phosphatidylethanolamine-binding protein (PEBP) family uncharacterized protein
VKLPLSLIAIGTALVLAACSKSAPPVDTAPDQTDGPEPSPTPIVLPVATKKFTVTSTAFTDGKPIPAQYTCQDASQLPPLTWSGDLAGGKFVAIVVDDADAPDGGYVQWLVTDLPAKPPATLNPDQLPDGAHAASNSDGDPSWTAPCPDPGVTHHYRFTVYSLDGPSGVPDGTDPAEALQLLAPHVKAEGQLTGTVTGK